MAEKKEQTAQQALVAGTMPYRVAMADVDAYGVVYYSNFFIMFERGRTELFRAIGIDYKQIFQQRQVLMPVVEAACRYVAPVVYDDLINIETAVTNIGPKGIRFDYRITRDDTVLAYGFTQHIFIDPQGRPINFGKEVIEMLKSKGIIKESPEEKPATEEDVGSKLKKLVSERIKEEKPN